MALEEVEKQVHTSTEQAVCSLLTEDRNTAAKWEDTEEGEELPVLEMEVPTTEVLTSARRVSLLHPQTT